MPVFGLEFGLGFFIAVEQVMPVSLKQDNKIHNFVRYWHWLYWLTFKFQHYTTLYFYNNILVNL